MDNNRSSRAKWILAALVITVAGALTAFTIFSAEAGSTADSALLFIVLPMMLAAGLIIAPAKTTHGRVFKVTTICLLLVAVAAHEGAICVVLAAPIVYAVAHGVTALVNVGRDRNRAYLLVLPLLLTSGLEGVDRDVRINPEQTVEVVRVVELSADEVGDRVGRGPQPAALRSIPLRLLGTPTPQRVEGVGLDPGARWMFAYHGSSHGPGGHTVFEVSEHTPTSVSFRIVEDSSLTARWFDWQTATLSWKAMDGGHTQVRLRIDYERGLDPSWYFGPINDALLHEGGAHLLDMLALR